MTLFDLENRKEKIKEYENAMAEPDFWNDSNKSKAIIKELNRHKKIIEEYESTSKSVQDLLALLNTTDQSDISFIELLNEEYNEVETKFNNFEIQTLLTGPYDNNNVILEFHPGAGGTESQDWANMLFNMYLRYAQNKGYKVEVLDYQLGDEAGIKFASLLISGENAYGYLKGESGVHRLVRISPFDSNARRHTSFASVEATPEIIDDGEIIIKDEDIRIDTYRASGAGGQHINKTDSAVRITHIPTGFVTACQTQRSQVQNKEMALMMLKSKLAAKAYQEKMDKLSSLRGEVKANEWGSQIRSYVLCPYTLVKDSRSGVESNNPDAVLNGDLDDFIFGYLKSQISEAE